MSTLCSDTFNHEATVLCGSVWDVDKEVVCSSSVFCKGRVGNGLGLITGSLQQAAVPVCSYIICHHSCWSLSAFCFACIGR